MFYLRAIAVGFAIAGIQVSAFTPLQLLYLRISRAHAPVCHPDLINEYHLATLKDLKRPGSSGFVILGIPSVVHLHLYILMLSLCVLHWMDVQTD